jgi:hypothetical protein
MVGEEKPKRRRLSDIEEGLRAKGTIGCHCLCPILHPNQRDICIGAAQRNVKLTKLPGIATTADTTTISVSMCEPCAAIHA